MPNIFLSFSLPHKFKNIFDNCDGTEVCVKLPFFGQIQISVNTIKNSKVPYNDPDTSTRFDTFIMPRYNGPIGSFADLKAGVFAPAFLLPDDQIVRYPIVD